MPMGGQSQIRFGGPEGIIEARAETVGDAMKVITRAENCARYLQSSGRKVGMKRKLPGKH